MTYLGATGNGQMVPLAVTAMQGERPSVHMCALPAIHLALLVIARHKVNLPRMRSLNPVSNSTGCMGLPRVTRKQLSGVGAAAITTGEWGIFALRDMRVHTFFIYTRSLPHHYSSGLRGIPEVTLRGAWDLDESQAPLNVLPAFSHRFSSHPPNARPAVRRLADVEEVVAAVVSLACMTRRETKRDPWRQGNRCLATTGPWDSESRGRQLPPRGAGRAGGPEGVDGA